MSRYQGRYHEKIPFPYNAWMGDDGVHIEVWRISKYTIIISKTEDLIKIVNSKAAIITKCI